MVPYSYRKTRVLLPMAPIVSQACSCGFEKIEGGRRRREGPPGLGPHPEVPQRPSPTERHVHSSTCARPRPVGLGWVGSSSGGLAASARALAVR